MIGAVHASIGAGIGSFFKNKAAAFVAGVTSHLAADMIPHKDLDPRMEVPLMAGMMLAIAKWRGLNSPEFWGALGAISPDSEHALLVSGIIEPEQEIFPTHAPDMGLHGGESDERWSQVIIAGASLLAVLLNAGNETQ